MKSASSLRQFQAKSEEESAGAGQVYRVILARHQLGASLLLMLAALSVGPGAGFSLIQEERGESFAQAEVLARTRQHLDEQTTDSKQPIPAANPNFEAAFQGKWAQRESGQATRLPAVRRELWARKWRLVELSIGTGLAKQAISSSVHWKLDRIGPQNGAPFPSASHHASCNPDIFVRLPPTI